MTDDVATLLRRAADRVPDRPGDLAQVERRARRRTRRSRAAVAGGVLIAVLLALTALRLPWDRPPVVDSGEAVRLELSLCRPVWCQEDDPGLQEAAALVRDDPAVREVRVVDVATRRQRIAEESGEPLSSVPEDAVGPLLEVTVVPGDSGLAAVGRRLRELTGAGVRRPVDRPFPVGQEPFDSEAVAGPVVDVASVTVAGQQVDLRMWAVDGGGRCLEVGELVRCWRDDLLVQDGAATEEAWGHPRPDVTCAWAPVGYEIDGIGATFADGTSRQGAIGPPPPTLLAGGGLVCTAGRTWPVTLRTTRPGGEASSSGTAPYTEVRPADQLGWRQLASALSDRLPEDRAAELASLDVAARQQAMADALTRQPLPEGVATIELRGRAHGVYRGGDEAPSTQVAMTVTPQAGDPVCVVALLYPDDADTGMLHLDRPAIWSSKDGCPGLP